MTGTSAACLHTNQSQSYLNHLVHAISICSWHLVKWSHLQLENELETVTGNPTRKNCENKYIFSADLKGSLRQQTSASKRRVFGYCSESGVKQCLSSVHQRNCRSSICWAGKALLECSTCTIRTHSNAVHVQYECTRIQYKYSTNSF